MARKPTRIDELLASHLAQVDAMFSRAQSKLNAAGPMGCGCDYCTYPLTVSRERKTPRAELVPVHPPRHREPIPVDPKLKAIYAKADRSGYDATAGLARIVPRVYPEGFRDFLFELRAVDEQAPGPLVPRSSAWIDARVKRADTQEVRCHSCNHRHASPSRLAAHSKAELDFVLDGYSRYPTGIRKPGKRPLKREEVRLIARQADDDLEDYNEYSDERTEREKQFDLAAFQCWRNRLPETLNLPPRHVVNALMRELVARLDFQRRDSGAPKFRDYVTSRVTVRLREVDLWIQRTQRNREAIDRWWMAEHLGLAAPREREAFRSHLLGLSINSIAVEMNVEISTVKEWLKRARKQVRTLKSDPWGRPQSRVPLARTFKYEESQPAYERA